MATAVQSKTLGAVGDQVLVLPSPSFPQNVAATALIALSSDAVGVEYTLQIGLNAPGEGGLPETIWANHPDVVDSTAGALIFLATPVYALRVVVSALTAGAVSVIVRHAGP